MKAIILISSIFYILGLKIGNKIESTCASDSEKTVVTSTAVKNEYINTTDFKCNAVEKTETDSIKAEEINNNSIPENLQ